MSQELIVKDVVSSSKYFKRFQKVSEEFFRLEGDLVLVERLPKIETKTAGGIILPSETPHTYKSQYKDALLELGIILKVGPGDVDENGERIPLAVKPGDIIELPANVNWYTQFGDMQGYEIGTIGKMRAAATLVKFPDYIKAMEQLNDLSDKEIP